MERSGCGGGGQGGGGCRAWEKVRLSFGRRNVPGKGCRWCCSAAAAGLPAPAFFKVGGIRWPVLICNRSIQLFFLRKLVRQWCTEVTSFHMQFEKIGCRLLREAFQSERECFVSLKRGGK